jgi:predicted RND superfamily exporter protein
MRIVLIILFLTLIGFGYLLSDNGHLQANLEKSQQQTTSLAAEKDTLQSELGKARSELAVLAAQNDELRRQILLLNVQNKQVQAEKQLSDDQNAQLRDQIKTMNRLNSLIGILQDLNPNSLMLAIFVPILPVSLATSFMVYRHGKIQNQSQKKHTNRSDRTLSIQVTEEEMKRIRQMRRHQ